jgi:hypothetical protein
MSGFWTSPHDEVAHTYQPKQWFLDLDTVIPAVDYFDRAGSKRNQEFPPLGAIRCENGWMGGGIYKNVSVDGYARFLFVWNNSGSDIAKGVPLVRRANQAISTLDSGTVKSATKAATFTANKEYGALVTIADNANSAGAAPEGEFGKIYWNDTTTIKFQPDMTTALAVTDDIIIIYKDHVLAAGSGAQLCDFRGVPVKDTGIPNGYMGWACIEADAVAVQAVAINTAITIGKGLIAGTAIFTNGSSAVVPTILAYALQGLKTDTVARLLMASLAPNRIRGISA